MSSAICFNLDQSKILSSGNGLTLLVTSLVLVVGVLVLRMSNIFYSALALRNMEVGLTTWIRSKYSI